ncbi:MAG: indolepyruvate ferredoxin oxidoreductase subunit alpha, partial [Pontixanthobacter sp.]
MAERSFAKEIEELRLGDGDTFRGEGILAITKALLQSGVSYVGGYQGSPISHLMDVLADANDLLDELGVVFQSSANEATAAAMLSASVMYPLRGAVAWKSTVGTNVASDALANLASGGVTGGVMVIVGEDYGEGSSIMQERTHAFAMKSQMWLLDPRPQHECLVRLIEQGFDLSEASNTPVMLEVRVRACHMHGNFTCKDNVRPGFTLTDALENPRRDLDRIVLPPAAYEHEVEKIGKRLPQAIKFIAERKLNEFLGPGGEPVGIILQGGMYNNVIRALQYLGLSDAYGQTRIPLYVMNVTYPMIDSEIEEFCRGKSAVLMVEEGQPDYLEQALNTVLRRKRIDTAVAGKGLLPMGGDYTAKRITDAIGSFLDVHAPNLLGNRPPLPDASTALANEAVRKLEEVVPARPPGLCTGCPERPIFAAMKLVEQDLGKHHVAADIGCHLFSILPPFNIGATTMGFGLGPASIAAFNVKAGKRPIAIMGDGGFWHNGLLSGVSSALLNGGDAVLVVMKNGYTSATGTQETISTPLAESRRIAEGSSATSGELTIENTLKGLGVKWLKTVHNYRVAQVRDTLREAFTTTQVGLKVIIAEGECQLERQRRIRPIRAKHLAEGKTVVRTRYGVDEDTCT